MDEIQDNNMNYNEYFKPEIGRVRTKPEVEFALSAAEEALKTMGENDGEALNLETVVDGLKELLEDPTMDAMLHLRNARAWIGLFGSEAGCRIQIFSWVLGIEPNFEELDDATEEEEREHQRQAEEMVRPIKEALDRENK